MADPQSPPIGPDSPAPRRPPGSPGQLTDRILVQTSMNHLDDVLRHVDPNRSGLVIARGNFNANNTLARIRDLQDDGLYGPVVYDRESYRRRHATPDQPFVLGDEGTFDSLSLAAFVDMARMSNQKIIMLPTGAFDAGDTDSLQSAAEKISDLRGDDFIVPVALDPSLLGPLYFDATRSILGSIGHPIVLILKGQLDPLDNNTENVIRNMRHLVGTVPWVGSFRTDLNAFDLMAHGAFSASIGTGGSTRHLVMDGEQTFVARGQEDDPSPSVLYPELSTFVRGSTIAKRFGLKTPGRCFCGECDGQSLGRFLSAEDHHDARAHTAASWQNVWRKILKQPTLLGRSVYWKGYCAAAVDYHKVLAHQLGQLKPFRTQPSIEVWARLSPWEQVTKV